MKKCWICFLLFTSEVLVSVTVRAAEDTSYILLAISAPTGMGSYELVFENIDDDTLVRVLDPATGNRFSVNGSPYLLEEVPPGRYFLSAINFVHDSDSQRIAQLRDDGDYIKVSQGISFIGSITIDIQAIQGANDVQIQYEPTSAVLRAAVSEEPELFRSHQVFVALPGSEPLPIEKNLLGL